MIIPIQLAGINGINAENAIRGLIPSRSSVSEAVIFFGTLILVALFFFTAAVIFRPRHHRRHSQHHHSKPAPNMDFEDDHRKKTFPDSYHKHRRHSEVFPVNPTLAEVGGLPPVRNKDRSPSMA